MSDDYFWHNEICNGGGSIFGPRNANFNWTERNALLPVSGLGLDSAAMELAPLIRPETTKAATGLTMPVPPSPTSRAQIPGTGNFNSGRTPGSQNPGSHPQGQVHCQEEGQQQGQDKGPPPSLPQPPPSASSPFSFSVPTPPPSYATAVSPLANARTITDSGTFKKRSGDF